MSYLLPRRPDSGQLVLVLAYGQLSYLEALTVMAGGLTTATMLCDDLVVVGLKNPASKDYEKLAGVYKVAVPVSVERSDWPGIPAVSVLLDGFEDGFNFSVSLYCHVGEYWEDEHERLCGDILTTIRNLGYRRANLIRPRRGFEVRGDDVVARRAIDFVALPRENGFRFAITTYVPESSEFERRTKERPVIGARISLSSRLARLLVNLGGTKRGEVVLDPFCGTGAILGEAMLKGIHCIGMDSNRGRVENAKQNLSWLSSESSGVGSHEITVGEAGKLAEILGGRQVDGVVTEPILLPRMTFTPTLAKAKKLIGNSSRLYSDALYSMAEVVRPGGRIVIVAPSLRTKEGIEVSLMFENAKEAHLRPFQPSNAVFSYPLRVAHESTRWIRRLVYVFERC